MKGYFHESLYRDSYLKARPTGMSLFHTRSKVPFANTSTTIQLDYRICSWVCLMFFALQLDRGNISQALSDGMLKDPGLSTNQYNYGMTIFYLCFLCAEVPSQMISKKLGPDR